MHRPRATAKVRLWCFVPENVLRSAQEKGSAKRGKTLSLLPDITDMVSEVIVCGRSSRLSNINALITWIRREVLEDSDVAAANRTLGAMTETAAEGLQEMGLEALGSATKPIMAMTTGLLSLIHI